MMMRGSAKTKSLGQRIGARINRLFPERQIHLRTEGRIAFIRLTRTPQIAIALMLLGAAGWTGYSSMTYLRHETILDAKDKVISNSRQAYRSLLGEVSEYQKKFTSLTTDLEENHALMLGLIEKNAYLQTSLSSVSQELTLTRSERKAIAAARKNLTGKLTDIEEKVRDIANRNFSLSDNLNSAEADLQNALAERNKSLYEGTHMRRRIKYLETQLAGLQEAEELTVQRLTDRTTDSIENMERMVKMTGLNIKQLIKVRRRPAGQGGPFIAAQPGNLPGKRLKDSLSKLDLRLDRWDALQDLMGKLPLSSPMKTFYITSSFGKRRDPINRRWASHYGLDMGGPLKTPVYATAPGVVTYAGWKGRFGKFVEITHGSGVKTRFAHLNKFFVKKGQKVKFHTKIGLLGSTGRSTGAHLHYEVVFKGRSRNPMKFIEAGRNVFKK